jgi:hypothetical protein
MLLFGIRSKFRYNRTGRVRTIRSIAGENQTSKKLVRLVQMKGRVEYASTGGDIMQRETHRQAAERHELAARAHRTAAEHNEKGDNEAGLWHSERALEYSDHAYKLAQEAHTKSGKIEAL